MRQDRPDWLGPAYGARFTPATAATTVVILNVRALPLEPFPL